MSDYYTGSIEDGIALFHEGVKHINNARSDTGRSKLQQAKRIFELCKDTDLEAKSWLVKTNQELSNI